MPVITLEGSQLSKEQKRDLISDLSQTASRIMQIPQEAFVVLIKENPTDNIGVGGTMLSERHPKK